MTITMLTIIAFAISALGGLGGLAAFLVVKDQRTKLRAEAKAIGVNADSVLSGRALEMVDQMNLRVNAAEDKADRCRREVDALRDHVDHLERLMRDAGLSPPPFRWPRLDMAGGEGG